MQMCLCPLAGQRLGAEDSSRLSWSHCSLTPARAKGIRRPCCAVQAVAKPGGEKQPLESRVLAGLLNASSVPYSAYVPEPRGVLHEVSALVKEVWLLCVLVGIARGSTALRLAIAAGCALVSIIALEGRLWRPQLFRLGLVSALVFVFTALLADGVPPVTEVRHMPGALQGLGPLPSPEGAYRYVLFNAFIVTVTTRSVRLAAATASLSFVALQSASLVLTTTPAEELALAVSTILKPLQFIGIPAKEIGLTLLLSLRFMALVFDEVRNLCLGLAARNIQWKSLGPAAGLQVSAQMFTRLFGNLMQRSDSIATSMQARGFVGPKGHEVHLARVQKPNIAADVAALALLAGSTYAAQLLT